MSEPSIAAGTLRPIAFAAALAVLGAGCIGIYNNTEKFLNQPKEGTSEAELLGTFGLPDFSSPLEGGGKVYGYKVRDVKYIILVGVYEGYDLLFTVQGGALKETKKIARPKAFTLFQPVPWAVSD